MNETFYLSDDQLIKLNNWTEKKQNVYAGAFITRDANKKINIYHINTKQANNLLKYKEHYIVLGDIKIKSIIEK